MKLAPALLIALGAIGCASQRVYLNRDVATAVVLAPLNQTLNRDAPWKMWSYIEREVASRGYRIVPHDKVWKFYESKKFTEDPGQITDYSNEELAKEFNVDAVIWSTLHSWDPQLLGIYNSIEVKIEAELHDRKGVVLWKGEGSDGYSSGGLSTKSILGGMFGAATANPEKYAPGAAARCFDELPWAGWDPKTPKDAAPPPEVK